MPVRRGSPVGLTLDRIQGFDWGGHTDKKAVWLDGDTLFTDAAFLSQGPAPFAEVSAFGAVGDGVTDDTAAINAALARLPTGGGTVRFAPGKTYWAPNLTTFTRSNITFELNGATLKTTATLKFTGDNVTIDLGGGKIDGGLKYTTIAAEVASGTNQITVTDASVFVVGDSVQSSYGLGGDGSNPIAINAIVGNTLTVAENTTGILPSGSKIGTWLFNATVSLDGDNNVLRNGTINLSRGIAIDVRTGSSQVTVEQIKVTNSALQQIQVINATKVVFRNCSFNNVLDAAKQTVGIEGANTEVAFEDCYFKPDNYDAIFFVGAASAPGTDEASIVLERCVLDADNTVLQTPYNQDGAVIYQNSGMLRQLTLRDCVMKNFRFGIATDTNSAAGTNAKRVVLDGCDFEGAKAPYTWFAAAHVPTEVLSITNCRIKATVSDFFETEGTFEGCAFVSCLFDTASNFGGRMTSCVFDTCTGVRFTSSAYLDGCYFNATTIGTYPLSGTSQLLGELHFGEVLFSHTDFPSGTLANVVAAQARHANTGYLREQDSTLPIVFYMDNAGTTLYFVDARTFWQVYPTELRNKDWRIPVNSRFHRGSSTPALHYVDKSNSTTLSANAIATATTLTVTSISGMASGDVLNVLCDDGRVHTTTINGAPSGSTVTLTDAMPAAAASGKGVCAYTYVAAQDADLWADYAPTWTGFSVAPTVTFRYKRVGKVVVCKCQTTVNGTSNATTLTMTLPVTAREAQTGAGFGVGNDNGATLTTPVRIDLSSTTVATFYTTAGAAGWTGSGGKGVYFTLTYEAA